MTLKLNRDHLETILSHGSRDYPNECCGMLLGHADGDVKAVTEVVPLRNLRHDPDKAAEIVPLEDPSRETERNRFLIDPLDQMRVEKDAQARSLKVVGYYHSHPDHPARPSTYDRDHAWPWSSYVILSVERGEPKDVNSWVLADDRSQFEAETLEFLNP